MYEERQLDHMPCDMKFEVKGDDGIYHLERCRATGKEVNFGDGVFGGWWNEYIDSNGEYQYGR